MTRLFTALAAVAALSVAAFGAPQDRVDRQRLRDVLQLSPADWVKSFGWYYTIQPDGRVLEGGQEPERSSVATLRARIVGDDTDAERWMDLAATCRRCGDEAQEKECVGRAVEIFRRRAAERPEDGQALASLGLALAAAGDAAGADDAIGRAQKAPRDAWAGTAASAEMLFVKAIAKAARGRFGSLAEAREWFKEDESRAARLDPVSLDAAAEQLDEAVAAMEGSGRSGPPATALYLLRCQVLATRDRCAPPGEPRVDRERRLAAAVADKRRAIECQPSNPWAVTLTGLDDAMTATPDATGRRHVQPFEKLTQAARTKFNARVARLCELAESEDSATAGAALQGLACLQWFVLQDAVATETTLRRSMDKDSRLQQTMSALVMVLGSARRWDDLAARCRDWIEKGDSAEKRMLLGRILSMGGHAEESEKAYGAAAALDPKSALTHLLFATAMIRRAETADQLAEARKQLRAALAVLPPPGDGGHDSLVAGIHLADAVALGLSGDVDGAEKAARRLLDEYDEVPQAREVLAAIGR